jgi:hypothetical protein
MDEAIAVTQLSKRLLLMDEGAKLVISVGVRFQ